ncbi:hypothetical protein EV384_4604 [Micromonospora kangleipakensis]|uniref:Uncharacterized protein n=1 Tax=Micromonospora kangleipakensis TaxID=1077942 RepID=A0A4Q8BEA1_9ACTN|nr:hypothetical protein EV384_4604 [Micromonospora kangleipakensis]
MTDRRPSPRPTGHLVPVQPPVPITVWHLPTDTELVSAPLAQRLIANFTHRRDLILDGTNSAHLQRAAHLAGRRIRRRLASHERAALIVMQWPRQSAAGWLRTHTDRLRRAGCLVVALASGDAMMHPRVISAARARGLTYVQHLVAVEAPATDRMRVHADVLVFHGRADG